ncbi:MAG: signal peptidase I [Clostridia bacterium]|nr:signal peptidase I [Clostridia bacterium]
MKTLSRLGNFFFYLLLVIILLAGLGSALRNTPFLFTVIRSNSMYPLLSRGDIVFVSPLSPTAPVETGDIVLFKTEGDSFAHKGWILHRIVAGDAENGFITQGDANGTPDQLSERADPIKREWIVAHAPTWGTHVFKCPLLGYLPLGMEKYQKSPYLLPCCAFLLTLVLAITEWEKGKIKRKKKKGRLDLPLIYIGSGLVISLLLLASMLVTSQKINLEYEVPDQRGIMQGSAIGILKEGDTAERFLAELKNKSFCPFVVAVTCPDPQITLNIDFLTLKKNEKKGLSFKVEALQAGTYRFPIWIGMYYPFLPPQILYQLQTKNIWLALIIVSLLPALPLFLYPFLDLKLRRQTKKEIRRFYRRIKRIITLNKLTN